jgi:hypothetical protein
MGLVVSGNYFLASNRNIRFEIRDNERSPEVIDAKISLQDDELTLLYGDGGEVEKYRKINP